MLGHLSKHNHLWLTYLKDGYKDRERPRRAFIEEIIRQVYCKYDKIGCEHKIDNQIYNDKVYNRKRTNIVIIKI